jgi:DNA-binding IclR family transcriptional regulator
MRSTRPDDLGPGSSGGSGLRGIEILRLLADAGEPVSPTELAKKVGLHQSSVSRILATLVAAGYVRKTSNRRFESDFGVLSLAAAVTNVPLVRKPRSVLEAAATTYPGTLITLSVLWRGQILYFLRAAAGQEIVEFWGAGFPVHQSAPGMCMLVSLPEAEALECLTASKARNGWPRQGDVTPPNETEALSRARELLEHDILVLDGWHQEGHFGAATLVDYPAEYPVALSLTAERELATDDQARVWLHEIRRAVEKSLQ